MTHHYFSSLSHYFDVENVILCFMSFCLKGWVHYFSKSVLKQVSWPNNTLKQVFLILIISPVHVKRGHVRKNVFKHYLKIMWSFSLSDKVISLFIIEKCLFLPQHNVFLFSCSGRIIRGNLTCFDSLGRLKLRTFQFEIHFSMSTDYG